MAVALIATPKSSTANAYADVAEGDAYFATRLNATAWTSETSPDKKAQALIMATARLEEERWDGWRTTAEQALKHPRAYLTDDDGTVYDCDVVIPRVKAMCFELALALLQAPASLDQNPLANYDQVRVGPLDVKFRQPQVAGDLPAQVERLGRGIMFGSGGPELLRG